MLFSEKTAVNRERLLEQLARPLGIALGVELELRILHQDIGRRRRGSLVALARELERLLQIRFRGHEMTAVGERARQVREGGGDAAIVDGALISADGNGLLEEWNCALAQVPDGDKPGRCSRAVAPAPPVAGSRCRDLGRAPIQEILRRGFVTLRGEWVGLREHIHQKRADLLRAVPFLRRLLARQLDAVVLPESDAGDECEGEECGGDGRYGKQWRRMNFAVL